MEAPNPRTFMLCLRLLRNIDLLDFSLHLTYFSPSRPIHRQSLCVSVPIPSVSLVSLGIMFHMRSSSDSAPCGLVHQCGMMRS